MTDFRTAAAAIMQPPLSSVRMGANLLLLSRGSLTMPGKALLGLHGLCEVDCIRPIKQFVLNNCAASMTCCLILLLQKI